MAGIAEQGQRANIEEASQEFQTRLLTVLGNPQQAELSWINNASGQELGHLEISEGAVVPKSSFGDLSIENGDENSMKSVADLVALPLQVLRVARADSLKVRIGSSWEPSAFMTATPRTLNANVGIGEGPTASTERQIVNAQVFADGSSDLCFTETTFKAGDTKPETTETSGDQALQKALDVVRKIFPGAFINEATESTSSDQ